MMLHARLNANHWQVAHVVAAWWLILITNEITLNKQGKGRAVVYLLGVF